MFYRLFIASSLALVATTGVDAALLTITNPSFENPALGPGGFGATHPGWINIAGSSGTFRPTAAQFVTIPDGLNTLFLASGGIVRQTLPDTLTGTAGSVYTLTAFAGDRLDLLFPGADLTLSAGGLILGTASATPAPANGAFDQLTVMYTTTGLEGVAIGQSLEITLQATAGPGQVNFDDVQLDFAASVPEPSTVLLLGVGVGLALLARRRTGRSTLR